MMDEKKSGRPSKYETCVRPRFAEITDWLNAGATDKEIAENLGLHKSTFCEYKKQFHELNELVKNGRRKAVQEIKASLFRRATGFTYKESKRIWKKIVVTKDEEKLPAELVQTEECEKYCPPDPTSALILLKHWDRNEDGSAKWTSDPASLEIRKQELELRKEEW